jgi:hypothetical protein
MTMIVAARDAEMPATTGPAGRRAICGNLEPVERAGDASGGAPVPLVKMRTAVTPRRADPA